MGYWSPRRGNRLWGGYGGGGGDDGGEMQRMGMRMKMTMVVVGIQMGGVVGVVMDVRDGCS